MSTEKTIWEVWTYDVWGNEEDGFTVNDRRCVSRAYEIDAPIERNNPGMPGEFLSAYPTDDQLRDALGIADGAEIECDGDDLYIAVRTSEDDYPHGEMICVSHASLSPIRKAETDPILP